MEELGYRPFPPRPAGELAILSYPFVPTELEPCQEHVFELLPPRPTRDHESQSGWVQQGECLACGRRSPWLDASWWAEQPTAQAVAATLAALREQQASAAPGHTADIQRRITRLQHLPGTR